MDAVSNRSAFAATDRLTFFHKTNLNFLNKINKKKSPKILFLIRRNIWKRTSKNQSRGNSAVTFSVSRVWRFWTIYTARNDGNFFSKRCGMRLHNNSFFCYSIRLLKTLIIASKFPFTVAAALFIALQKLNCSVPHIYTASVSSQRQMTWYSTWTELLK